MTLETFTTLIEGVRKYDQRFHALYDLGVDLLSLNDNYYRDVIKPLMHEAFGDNVEMVDWFLYERRDDWGKTAAMDNHGNPICYDIPSLYSWITQNQRTVLPESKKITKPMTLAEIKNKLESNDYSAEMLLQHLSILVNKLCAELDSCAADRDDARKLYTETEIKLAVQGKHFYQWVDCANELGAQLQRRYPSSGTGSDAWTAPCMEKLETLNQELEKNGR